MLTRQRSPGAPHEARSSRSLSRSSPSSWSKSPTTPRSAPSSSSFTHANPPQPGFEKQQTTTEGQIASELYNERTFVLTRAFVKRACEYPPVGFEDEIKAYYYSGLPTTGPGALVGIVEQAKALLEESERFHLEPSEEEDEGKKRVRSVVIPAQNVLTEGAVLSLKRTLSGLEGLL